MIEKFIVPHARTKVEKIEANVRKTRAGKINMFKNFFKESERKENEGIMSGFKMNKNEIELRSLTDLAFII